MAQSIGHHGNPHHHNPTQNLGQSNHNHTMQHNSLHSNFSHPATHSASATHPHHHKPSHDNDEEAIARKKKNADAQAAFRQRRQTYIKSLEDTVAELKGAVAEMEVIVKATSHEAKIQRQQVEFLETKLAAYESAELKPGTFDQQQHCKCCKFATQDFTPRLPTPTSNNHHQVKSLPTTSSTSSITINPSSDCPTPTGPSIFTPTLSSQEGPSRDWPSRQGVASLFQSNANSRQPSHRDSSIDPPNSTKSLDYPRNILHQSRPNSSSLHNSSFPRSNCDLSLFPSFGPSEGASISNFYPSADGSHGSSAQPSGHVSPPGSVTNSLELNANSGHLQSVIGHSYDRSPPIRDPNTSLGGSYSPLGPQSFDGHPSDAGPSGYRLHQGINERSIMRPADYLPSLELRPLSQSYPLISNLASPSAESAFGMIASKTRSSSLLNKRRRDWGDDKFGPNHDTNEPDDTSTSFKTGSGGKLNGIPAKVARCEQAILDASKSVFHAKEEAKTVTTMATTSSSTAHDSLSPTPSTCNAFNQLHNPTPNSSKFQRLKVSGSTAPTLSATPALAPCHPSTQDEHAEQGNHRYQSLVGNRLE